MSEAKVTAGHLRRGAVVYVRQSTMAQLSRNRESTTRQYDLVARAVELGWPRIAVRVIDEDLGMSGASTAGRAGFAEPAPQVGLGEVGIVLALEVSRLACNNADWYRLLDLAGMTDTLIADTDGIYHPGLFNDRMLLGMKGTMSEAELHILRARLDGGIRSKAARGELRRALPVGLVWGEADGQIRFHPDEAVSGVIAAVFERFAVSGSVRGVWLWLRDQGLKFPLQRHGYVSGREEITWVAPTYHAVHTVLTHPAYAGAYVFGRTRAHRSLDADGQLRTSRHRLPQDEWEVLITDHHRGFIDWDTYQANQIRIRGNIRPRAHQPGTGAAREGCALLQGLATCGVCGRKLAVYYDGPAKTTPGYYCTAPGSWSRAAARVTCASAARGSTPRLPRRSWPRCNRRRCRPAWPPPGSSKTATTPRWRSGGARSSRPATKPVRPNAATAPSTRTTGWSPAVWRPSGTPHCKPSPTPRPNSPAAPPHDRKP